jgi:hypothetical protein
LGGNIQAPYWVKLNITGSQYTGYISPDGLNWVQLGETVDAGFGNGMPVYAGLAITSGNNDDLATADIDNYSLGSIQPLKLISFTGSLTLNNTVDLQWVTTLETKTSYFIVERTTNFMNYTVLDTVYADDAGDFTETYEAIDAAPLQAMNYYRLRIVNTDGSISYSPVVAIRFTNSKAPLMFPNPAKTYVNIVPGTDSIKQVAIYDVMGRPVLKMPNAPAGTINLPTGNMANGLYFVVIWTRQLLFKQKLVIQH